MPFPVGPWEGRATALALPDGGFIVVNPGPGQKVAATRVLGEHGGVRALVLMNHFHHLGLRRWRARLPDVPVVASDRALPRLAKQGHYELDSVSGVEEILPEHACFLHPAGTRSGEIWLRVETERGVAWAVGDAFFNVSYNPPGFYGFVARLTGTTPGPRFGLVFKYLHLSDRAAYRDWVMEQLTQDPPRILVPAHGDLMEGDDLPDRLSALVRGRLG
ncbi:MAG: hypothetical protein CME06_12535 [Gemmatimonadetes bacterium]|nr:hypothetical protein [Gemmatimonadota bacterium]